MIAVTACVDASPRKAAVTSRRGAWRSRRGVDVAEHHQRDGHGEAGEAERDREERLALHDPREERHGDGGGEGREDEGPEALDLSPRERAPMGAELSLELTGQPQEVEARRLDQLAEEAPLPTIGAGLGVAGRARFVLSLHPVRASRPAPARRRPS